MRVVIIVDDTASGTNSDLDLPQLETSAAAAEANELEYNSGDLIKMALPLACAAILGRENEPLYIRAFGDVGAHELNADADGLKWHLYVFSALDIIESRLAQKKESGASADPYLGLLCPIDEYRVYGYVSNTKTKFVCVVHDVSAKETEIKAFLRKLHSLYVDTISSPFATIGARLDSSAPFHARVRRVRCVQVSLSRSAASFFYPFRWSDSCRRSTPTCQPPLPRHWRQSDRS